MIIRLILSKVSATQEGNLFYIKTPPKRIMHNQSNGVFLPKKSRAHDGKSQVKPLK